MMRPTAAPPPAPWRPLADRRLRLLAGDNGRVVHPDYAKALAGSPAPLAALHQQAQRAAARRGRCLRGTDRGAARLPGGGQRLGLLVRALPLRVPALPAGRCRVRQAGRLPRHRQTGLRRRRRTFLREEPVPYPSYTDPDEEIAESIDGDATRGLPTTAFYDRGGELAFLKLGPYDDEAELQRRHRALRTRPRVERRIIGGMDVFVVIALVGVALLRRGAAAADWRRAGGARRARADRRRRARPHRRRRLQRQRLGRPGADHARCALRGSASTSSRRKVLAAHRDQPVRAGHEELIGARAEVRTSLDPEGQVWIEGALWRARLVGDGAPLRPGDRVTVEAVEGLTLVVRPESRSSPRPRKEQADGSSARWYWPSWRSSC